MKEHYGVLYPDLGGSYTHTHGYARTHMICLHVRQIGIAIDTDIQIHQ